MGILEEGQVEDGRWRREVDGRLEEHDNHISEHARKLEQGNQRFSETEVAMRDLEQKIEENTVLTKKIEANTSEILEIFTAFRGFVKVSGWGGKALLWLAGIIVAIGILYWAIKTGDLPRKP